jgi:hypothetical protein
MPVHDEGNGVFSFTDFDEYLEWQADQERRANDRVHDFQAALRPGMKVFRLYPLGPQLLTILGRTVTPDQHYESMVKEGYEISECEEERDMIAEQFDRGYLYGTWYSTIEPQGELGSAHISVLGPQLPDAVWEKFLAMVQSGRNPGGDQ